MAHSSQPIAHSSQFTAAAKCIQNLKIYVNIKSILSITKNMTSGNMIIENQQSERSLLSPGQGFALCLQKNNNLITTILIISSIINKRGILPN